MKAPPSFCPAGKDNELGWRFRITENAPCFCPTWKNSMPGTRERILLTLLGNSGPPAPPLCARTHLDLSGQPRGLAREELHQFGIFPPKEVTEALILRPTERLSLLVSVSEKGRETACSRGQGQAHTRMGFTLLGHRCQQNF